jgi:hypothetical protein
MPKPNQPAQPQKTALTSPFPIADKPWVRKFPTPSTTDYIVSVRKDMRVSEFKMPNKGDPYKGADQQNYLPDKFVFATSVPVEQLPGFVDLYYLAPFESQEDYNFTVAYPYVDRDYPVFTRTYVVQRTDKVATEEPIADTKDPKFGLPFVLTDHKIERFTDDNVMDALFVKVIRVFERLPSPTITSFASNQYQQPVTLKTQEVVKSAPPSQSAITEEVKQERTGTAKAKNIVASVPDVFPQTILTTEIPSMTRELWLGGFIELMQETVSAGQATTPTLGDGEFNVTEKQETEFKKRHQSHILPLPQTRVHGEWTSEFGGGVLDETIEIVKPDVPLVVEHDLLTTESKVRNLPITNIRMTKKRQGTEWPELREDKTVSEGPYSGVVVETLKKVVAASEQLPFNYNPFATGIWIDYMPHDEEKTMRLKSRILSYPQTALVYYSTEEVHFPAQLSAIDVQWTIANSLNSHTELSIDNSRGFAYASGHLTQSATLKPAIREGYRGWAKARITRTFQIADSTGSILSSLVPQVFAIIPSYGYAFLPKTTIGGVAQRGNESNEISSAGELGRQTEQFGPLLSSNYDQDFLAPYSSTQPVSAGPVTTTGPKPGTWSATLIVAGERPTAHVTIPQSTPAVMPSGQYIVWQVRVTRGLLNLYAIEVVEVLVP